MMLGAGHGHVEQAAALFLFAPLPFLAQGVLEEIVLILARGGIAPARAQAVMAREGDHGHVGIHALVDGGDEDDGELQTLGRVHGHDLHRVGGIFRRGVGFARIFLADQGQFGDEFIERHARRGVARLRQELVEVGRGRVAAIVDGGEQQAVERDVLAALAPFVQAGGEAGDARVIRRRKRREWCARARRPASRR